MTKNEIERPQIKEDPANKTKSEVINRGYNNKNRGDTKEPR